MKADWESKDTVDKWVAANGSEHWRHGDLWRMALVNPIVLHLAKDIAANGFNYRQPMRLWEGVRDQRMATAEHPNQLDALHEWHEERIAQSSSELGSLSLEKLRVLDLGCGDGYLLRWLSEMGAEGVGVDLPAMIVEAEKRAAAQKLPRRPRLHAQDLSTGIQFDFLAEDPDMVTAIILYDHMEDPLPSLRSVARLLSQRAGAVPFLVFTLNPAYFEGISIAGDGDVAKINVTSGGFNVDVCFRRIEKWETIFRDSGFDIIEFSPIYFKASVEMKRALIRLFDGLEEAHANVAPFYCWLMVARPEGESVDRDYLQALLKSAPPGSFLEGLGERDKDYLLKNCEQVRSVVFGPNQRILFSGNLGVDAYIIESGEACLVHDCSDAKLSEAVSRNAVANNDREIDGRKIKQVFSAGDIIGELETSASYLASRYVYSIDAGVMACRVLRIPRNIFEGLMACHDDGGQAGSALFKRLRDKIVHNSWLLFGSSGRGDTFDFSGLFLNKLSISNAILSGVSRGLMQAATMEMLEHRVSPTNGPVICLPVQDIQEIASFRDTATFKNCLALLAVIGAIDYNTECNGGHLTPIGNSVWNRFVVSDSRFKGISANGIRGFSGFGNSPFNTKGEVAVAAKNFCNSICDNLSMYVPQVQAREITLRVSSNCYFAYVNLLARSPVFIHLLDINLLRYLAFSPDTEACVAARVHSIVDTKGRQTLSEVQSGVCRARLQSFLSTVNQYLDYVWSRDLDLEYTGCNTLMLKGDGKLLSARDIAEKLRAALRW